MGRAEDEYLYQLACATRIFRGTPTPNPPELVAAWEALGRSPSDADSVVEARMRKEAAAARKSGANFRDLHHPFSVTGSPPVGGQGRQRPRRGRTKDLRAPADAPSGTLSEGGAKRVED